MLRQNEWADIDLVDGMEASFHHCYTMFYGMYLHKQGYVLLELLSNLKTGVLKISHSISIFKTCFKLSSTKVDAV